MQNGAQRVRICVMVALRNRFNEPSDGFERYPRGFERRFCEQPR
jgi:hypothetical protein